MKTTKLLLLCSLVVVIALVVVACGGTEAPKEEVKVESTKAPAQEEAKPTEAPAPAEDAGYKMAGITFYSDFFMQTVIDGMKLAADENGIEFSNHVTEFDLEKEAQIIDDLITKGVDAIIITPISSDGSIAALKKAKEAGVTVVCFNTCVNEEGIASAFLYTDGIEHGGKTGKAVAEYVKNEMGGSAKLGILNCEIYELCVERLDGFMAELEGLDIEVVDNQQGFVADEAVTVAEDMLQAHPDINLMWSENEGGTVGIVQAVKSLGMDGELPVFGLDMNMQMAQMLQSDDGILLGTTGQSPYDLGYMSLNTAIDVLNGKEVEPVTFSPAIYFGRDTPEKVQEFIDTEGKMFATDEPEAEAPSEPAGEGYKMAGITFYSDFFMQTVIDGMKLAAEENGIEFSNHVTEFDLEKEAQIIDDLITKGVDAIIITPISSDGSIAALKKAKEAGVTVVCFNTCVNEEGIASAFLYTDGIEHGGKTGKAVAEYVKNEMGGSAKLGILNCEIYELCVERLDGFMAELEGLDIEVVDNQQGFVADEAVTVAEDMLSAHPDINLMWSENEGGTVGIVQAVKTLGLGDQVPVFGLDMNMQMAQMLQSDDGILLGTTGQSPYDLGYMSLNTAVDVLNGKEVEPVTFSPAIYFGRTTPEKVQEFIDTEGKMFATDEPEAEAPSGPQGEGYKMAGITFYSDFFMQTVIDGMKLASEENGVEFSNHVTEFDLEKEAQIIDDLITKGVDAIIITPISSDGSTAALKKAKEAGVTVVCFNTCVNEEGIASAFLYTDGIEHGGKTGKAVAEYVKNEMGGSAKLGILNCEIYELCVERLDGFMAELEGLDIEVVDNQQGFVADEAVTVAEDMLSAHPDINLMWSENEGGTVGIVQAVKTLGLADQVPVFGLDMNMQMAQMLQSDDGILLGTTGQSPYDLGYMSLNTAIDVLNGKEVEPVTFSPAIYFGRDTPEKVQEFIDTEGKMFAK